MAGSLVVLAAGRGRRGLQLLELCIELAVLGLEEAHLPSKLAVLLLDRPQQLYQRAQGPFVRAGTAWHSLPYLSGHLPYQPLLLRGVLTTHNLYRECRGRTTLGTASGLWLRRQQRQDIFLLHLVFLTILTPDKCRG